MVMRKPASTDLPEPGRPRISVCPRVGFAVRRALFVEVEAKAAALRCREKRDRHAPGHFPAGLAKRGAVEGREIGEVVVRDRGLAAARAVFPGCCAMKCARAPEGFRDQVYAGGGGDVRISAAISSSAAWVRA